MAYTMGRQKAAPGPILARQLFLLARQIIPIVAKFFVFFSVDRLTN